MDREFTDTLTRILEAHVGLGFDATDLVEEFVDTCLEGSSAGLEVE